MVRVDGKLADPGREAVVEGVVNERSVEDRDEGLGQFIGERAQSGSQSGPEKECFGDRRAHVRGVAV